MTSTDTSTLTAMQRLAAAGQSVWLDYIRRDLLESGELARLVADGLRGMTSNPSIFEKAIAGSDEYDDDLQRAIEDDPEASAQTLFERLAIADIQAAADVLATVYDQSPGADGFVSLEVSPTLAHDTDATIAEAKRLWAAVDRPNLMIKVPATAAGIPAIEALIAEGVNVNVTLMFSMSHYEAVAGAFLRGLERTPEPGTIGSVASFFVSRVDTKVDALLEEVGTPEALALRGKIAIANCKAVYRRFEELFGDDFEAEWGRGALPQRLLWASTSTKNPAYSDVLYVEELVGPHTVNTLPPATLQAFEDHGVVKPDALRSAVDEALADLARLSELGIDLEQVGAELQSEGVEAFAASFTSLLETIEAKRSAI